MAHPLVNDAVAGFLDDPKNKVELTGHQARMQKEVELAVQVNGKIRDRITVPADADDEQVRQKALASDKVVAALAGRQPKKVIVVKGRLVNIIV